MQKCRIGIIGMGRMGITHYSIINTHPQVEIVAIADTSKIILDILSKYIPNLQVYKDYKELLQQAKPDAVLICTPSNLHHEVCSMACELGIHAFVEKPFTANPTQAEELLKRYRQKGLVHQVGYVNRFNDVFTTVKQYAIQGLIGDVLHFKSEMYSSTISKKEETESWRSFRENGGGATYEMASHAIDLVNYLVGKPDEIIGTNMSQVYSKHVEDIVSSTFLYKNGCSGSLYVNWCDTSYRKPANKLELLGDKGKIIADQHSMKIYLNKDDENTGYKMGWNTVYITDVFKPVPFYVRGYEFTRQLYYFVDTILGKENGSMCTFEDGYATQRIIHHLFEDAKKNNIKEG
jgi:predicted dehydrogenase